MHYHLLAAGSYWGMKVLTLSQQIQSAKHQAHHPSAPSMPSFPVADEFSMLCLALYHSEYKLP
jgi:hypothetical protein